EGTARIWRGARRMAPGRRHRGQWLGAQQLGPAPLRWCSPTASSTMVEVGRVGDGELLTMSPSGAGETLPPVGVSSASGRGTCGYPVLGFEWDEPVVHPRRLARDPCARSTWYRR